MSLTTSSDGRVKPEQCRPFCTWPHCYCDAREHAQLELASPDIQTAPGFLRRAAEIMDERGKQYDKPEGERSMGKCVTAFNAITGHDLTEAEGWLLLQVLKDVRLWQRPGFHQDSAEDCIAYAALKAEAKQSESDHAPV